VHEAGVLLEVLHEVGAEAAGVVVAAAALVQELAGVLAGLQDVFPQVLLRERRSDTRSTRGESGTRALVDLAVVLVVHPHVPLEVARQLRPVVAVLAAELDVQLLVLARVAGEEKRRENEKAEQSRQRSEAIDFRCSPRDLIRFALC
jgi:hypothetical protein